MSKIINSNMEQYCIYLRKSRKDEEAELMGAGETLARHEKEMLRLAKSKNLIIGKIYREIVSGDSIAARPIMQELLQDVENGIWAGVLVVEVERLARGNTIDQGIVSEAFKYSSTKILTPSKTYNPNDEFDEEYFEFGLFMSRREYKAIKRRLHNGTLASIREGKHVSKSPFGYDSYKLKGKGFSLKPNDDAKTVKLIFELYINGNNLGEIAQTLATLGLKPKFGGKWSKSSLHHILTNVKYVGKISYIDQKYLKKKDSNGNIIKVLNPNPTVYLVKGLHEPIVDEETFEKAQIIHKNHQLADTRTREELELKNPLSGLIKCKVCGKTMKRKSTRNGKYVGIVCKTSHHVSSSRLELVEQRILDSLKILLENYKLDIIASNQNNDLDLLIDNTNKQIQQLNKELIYTSSQKNKLYDFLERGIYDEETFFNRSDAIASKICEIKNKIEELESLNVDYNNSLKRKEQIIPNIKHVIDTYPYASIEQKNKLLKSCLKKIEYYKNTDTHTEDSFEITLFPLL